MPNEEMGNRTMPQPPDVATDIVITAVAGFLGFVAVPWSDFSSICGPARRTRSRRRSRINFLSLRCRKTRKTICKFRARAAHGAFGLWLGRSIERLRGSRSTGDADRRSPGRHAYDAPEQPAVTSTPTNRMEFGHEVHSAHSRLMLWPACAWQD